MMIEAPIWLELVILTLASLRLAVLVSADRITRTPRERLTSRLNKVSTQRLWERNPAVAAAGVTRNHIVSELLVCTGWCTGFWTSAALVIPWLIFGSWVTTIAAPLAVAGAVGILTPDDDDPEE
jgi:hypothetical protein